MKVRIKTLFRTIKESLIHVGWLAIFIIPIFVVINVAFIVVMNTQRDGIILELTTNAQKELNNIDLYINTQLQSVHDDLYIINDAEETTRYLEDPTPSNRDTVEQLIYRITTNKPHFINAMLANTSGDILYKVSRSSGSITEENTGLGSISDEAYFNSLEDLTDHQIYLSGLKIQDDYPLITLAIPLINEDNIINYVIVEYNANSFLFVFGLYSNDDLDYLSLGLINSGTIWIADATTKTVSPLTDSVEHERILNDIDDEHQIVTAVFNIRQDLDHYYIDSQTIVHLFMQYDLDSAIADSGYFTLTQPWTIFLTNLILIIMVGYIAYIIRSAHEAQVQINANKYLSAQNENAIAITDRHLRITYVNPAFEELFGYRYDALDYKNIHDTITMRTLYPDFNIAKHDHFADNHWYQTKKGIYFLKYVRIRKQVAFGKRDRHYIAIYSEPQLHIDDYITYIKHRHEELAILKPLFLLHDFNIETSTLVMIHIDHGDTYKFAFFLKQHLDEKCLVTVPKLSYIILYCHQPEKALNDLITLIDHTIDVYRFLPHSKKDFSYHFSVAHANQELHNYDLLIDAVITSSSYESDKNLKYHIYEPSMKDSVLRKHIIYEALNEAFIKQEFYIVYQLQKDLKKCKFHSVEALLRWHNSYLGDVYPSEFIPIIENSYFINQLSLMVLELVIKDLKNHAAMIPDDLNISINLSSFDFSNDYVIKQLIKYMEDQEISPSRFIFEITESIYIDNIEQTNHTIAFLHEKGVKVALDDLGTGYSSINSLKSIHVDYVKTDRQFMMGYPHENDGTLLERMIHLIHSLGKPVVVEGTETDEHIAFCKKHQVEYIQGYVITKPIPIETIIEKFLNTPHKKD